MIPRKYKFLHKGLTSVRTLPVNISPKDLWLFEHELEKEINDTILVEMQNIYANFDGILLDNQSKIVPECIISKDLLSGWKSLQFKIKLSIKNCIYKFKSYQFLENDVYWITDNLSINYFHWITDALPRLFTIQEELKESILLLPGNYKNVKYIISSLSPFLPLNIKFIQGITLCRTLKIPKHTAPTGNYNEIIIRELRDIYLNYYCLKLECIPDQKIYISRSKAIKRKILNENEIDSILDKFEFKTLFFEDLSFEEQIRIISRTRYLVSNHGAGLTNMIFMKPGGSVLEMRKIEDSHNNCYFSLASSLNLHYFYQLCQPQNIYENANSCNLIVDFSELEKNIKNMLS